MILKENKMNTRKNGSRKANWALKYMENSDTACSSDIRFFRHRKNAHNAMVEAFQKQDNILHFPACEDPFAESHRSITYESIHVQMGIDSFHWEIVKIIPEDA